MVRILKKNALEKLSISQLTSRMNMIEKERTRVITKFKIEDKLLTNEYRKAIDVRSVKRGK